MIKPLGGRGKRAPYGTVVLRVPLPLLSVIEPLIESYRTSVLSGNTDLLKTFSKDEVVAIAKKVLAQKKSAKLSVLKLLQVLYNYDIELSDLE